MSYRPYDVCWLAEYLFSIMVVSSFLPILGTHIGSILPDEPHVLYDGQSKLVLHCLNGSTSLIWHTPIDADGLKQLLVSQSAGHSVR